MKKHQVIKAFLIATVTALTLRLFVIEDYRVASDSMSPNLLQGDLVLVSKSAFNLRLPFSSFELLRTGRPKRSEVVAFFVPGGSTDTYIKRIIAVGGDRVEIKNGKIWLNGEAAQYEAVGEQRIESWASGTHYSIVSKNEGLLNYGPVDIPEGHFFVLGDNRSDSVDSRVWGPIPYSCLKGRVSLVWLSIGAGGEIRPNRWLSSIQ